MSVEKNLPLVRDRRQAALQGNAEDIKRQHDAGKLTARERIAAQVAKNAEQASANAEQATEELQAEAAVEQAVEQVEETVEEEQKAE